MFFFNKKISFEKLQIFNILFDSQSFSAAAKILNTHQSVVSRTIKEIEKTLNKKLILQTNKPIILTQDGKNLYNFTKKIEKEAEKIKDTLIFEDELKIQEKKILFITIPTNFSFILLKKIKSFLNIFPEVSIDISLSNTLNQEILNLNDLIITSFEMQDNMFETQFLTEYEMCFGASKEYIKKFGFPKFPESLKHHKFIYTSNHYYDFINQNIAKNLSNRFQTENEFSTYQAIEKGIGLSIIPKISSTYFKNIIKFDISEKVNNLKFFVNESKVKKNVYSNTLIEFFKN